MRRKIGSVIRTLWALVTELGRSVSGIVRTLVAHLPGKGSPARQRGTELLLWMARLIVEWWIRSRW